MGLIDFYKLFFAIPFDAATRSIYDDYVIPKLQSEYPGKLICVVGNKQVGQSSEYDKIETFKMQNSELFKHFVAQIRGADIIIADLTDNNPNVHVELGIALSFNKNILRVTRQSFERLGFDVRNYEVDQYRKGGDLFDKITNYLNLFLKIKNLDIGSSELPIKTPILHYCPDRKFLNNLQYEGEKKLPKKQFSVDNTDFQMRDGKVQVDFLLRDQCTDDDWFGIFLRVADVGINSGCILVYIRKNGNLEIATFPRVKVLQAGKLHNPLSEPKTLQVELEGDSISANIDNVNLVHTGLDIQSPGFVKLVTYRSEAEYWNLRIVCRDTIETFDRIGQ